MSVNFGPNTVGGTSGLNTVHSLVRSLRVAREHSGPSLLSSPDEDLPGPPYTFFGNRLYAYTPTFKPRRGTVHAPKGNGSRRTVHARYGIPRFTPAAPGWGMVHVPRFMPAAPGWGTVHVPRLRQRPLGWGTVRGGSRRLAGEHPPQKEKPPPEAPVWPFFPHV